MITDLFDAPAPIVRFDHLGRYLLPDPISGEIKHWTRVTTFAKTLADTYHLDAWKRRKVAQGLAARPDLVEAAASVEDVRTLNQICDEAMEAAGANDGRNHGTAMHSVIERINRGENPKIPDHMAADVAAYLDEVARAGLEILPEYVERRVINREYNLAGTFDGIGRLPDGGLPLIVDLKTAADMGSSWLETSVQLACYAGSEHVVTEDLTGVEPMLAVDQEVALVIHLPAGQGTCQIHEVDISTGYSLAELTFNVRGARSAARSLARPLR